MSAVVKDQFENTTGHWVGVVVVNRKGEIRGASVAPGDRVWLSGDEQALTAEAPKKGSDNPLANGTLRLVTEGQNIKSTRPLRPIAGAETGAVNSSPVGQRAPGEEGNAITTT